MPLPSATSDSSPRDANLSSIPPADQGLPKHRLLRKRPEFQKVYEEGQRISGRLFTLFIRQSSADAPGRFGMTVSRKVGRAVVRVRVKRLLRESVRLCWDLLPRGSEAVFHARPVMRDADFAAVQSEVKRALQKAARPSGGESTA
jgi:ribonuclease P protein component